MSETSDYIPYAPMLPVAVPNDVPLGANILFAKQCDHCLSRSVDCKYSRSMESTRTPTRCDGCWINGRTCTYNLLSAYGGLTIEDDMPLSALAYMDKNGFRINPRLQGRDLILAEGAVRYFLEKSSARSYSVLTWPCEVYKPIFGNDEEWPVLEQYKFPKRTAMNALSVAMLGYNLEHRCRPPIMPWVVETCGTGVCLPIAPFRHLDYLRPRVSPLWQHEGPIEISWLQHDNTRFQQAGSPGWHPSSRSPTPPPAYPQFERTQVEARGETDEENVGNIWSRGSASPSASSSQLNLSTATGINVAIDGNFVLGPRRLSSRPLSEHVFHYTPQSSAHMDENVPATDDEGAAPPEANNHQLYIDIGGVERQLNQAEIRQISVHRSRYLHARTELLQGSQNPCWQLFEMGRCAMDEELVTNLPFGLVDLADGSANVDIQNVDGLRDGMDVEGMMLVGWRCWDLAARAETPPRGGFSELSPEYGYI
ncbi:uncharacterized protein BXZ73DRAFT_73862 [Epithele typhae]|uniref:uncharacterized protein n=1 Tax=Epithele typhae TaxID=378194 RepID=UPI0020078150|nr:uncharacterized protein BXZ73DRAFT_73862 [Epithele typhae]KAH9944314.1 hypothetical protein BXZ73DRAFT_73862 [Epithele typhae]